MGDIRTREYRIFQEEEAERRKVDTFYEKLCRFAGKILRINPDKNTRKKLEESIDFTDMAISPSGSMSLAILSFTIFFLMVAPLAIFGLISITVTLFLLLAVPLLSIFLLYYPTIVERKMRMKIASEMVVMFLYIAISMRQSPNLEKAVKFAAENIKGPLAWQLRRLLWDVELRKYSSVQEGLLEYNDKYWKDQGKEASQAFELIVSSLSASSKRREDLLDEAVSIVLDGTRERAKHYAQDLRLPVTLVNTLGILLPIVALVLLPILLIFIGGSSNPITVVLMYNIILPGGLYFGIKYILLKRPWTFSLPNLENYPGQSRKGWFKMFGMQIPSLVPALLVGLPVFIAGIALTLNADKFSTARVMYSLLSMTGIAFGFGTYLIINSKSKTEVRDKIVQTEEAFAEALFEVGNKLYSGTPLEV